MNINTYVGVEPTNTGMRDRKVELMTKHVRYAADGVTIAEIQETTTAEAVKRQMRVRGPRKQTAARLARPLATVKVIQVGDPVDPEVAIAQHQGVSSDELTILGLEVKIRKIEFQLQQA